MKNPNPISGIVRKLANTESQLRTILGYELYYREANQTNISNPQYVTYVAERALENLKQVRKEASGLDPQNRKSILVVNQLQHIGSDYQRLVNNYPELGSIDVKRLTVSLESLFR